MAAKLGYAVVNREQLIQHCKTEIAGIDAAQKEAGEWFVQKTYEEDFAKHQKYWRWFWWLGFKEPTLESTRKKIAACVLLSFEHHIFQRVDHGRRATCLAALKAAERLSREDIEVSLEVLNACRFQENSQ